MLAGVEATHKKAAQSMSGDSQKRLGNHASTSTQAQRLRLLDALTTAQSRGVTTIEARHGLNVMMPAARILELRQRGYSIQTVKQATYDEHNRRHSGVARYILTGAEVQHG